MTRLQSLCGLALAGLISLSTATTANAGTINIIDIGNDPTFSWTWAENLTLGYDFNVSAPLTFNALAVFDVVTATPATGHLNALGLTSSHQVGVWDSLGNLLVSTTVNPGDPTTSSANSYGQWVYHLITPFTLSVGSYTIGAFYLGGIASSDPVMVQQTAIANSVATYAGGQYIYANSFSRPVSNYAPNEQQYFGPTLLSVPDGGLTLTLLGGAMMGLAAFRRKFNS